jgi:hypothetical protein
MAYLGDEAIKEIITAVEWAEARDVPVDVPANRIPSGDTVHNGEDADVWC